MKTYTQKDVDTFPVEGGTKHCLTGKYVDCSFGSDCSFEEHKARTSNPYIAIDRAGSELRKTYVFDFTDGLYVRSGCFFGTLQEFRAKVLADDTTPASAAPRLWCTSALQTLPVPNLTRWRMSNENFRIIRRCP